MEETPMNGGKVIAALRLKEMNMGTPILNVVGKWTILNR